MRKFETALWVCAALLATSEIAVAQGSVGIGGKLVKLDTRNAPERHQFLFKAVQQSEISVDSDPTLGGATLIVTWVGPGGAGRTDAVQLAASNWKGLGNPAGSKGYKYSDKSASAGGVKLVLYKEGQIKVIAKGANWSWELSGPNGLLWVTLRFANTLYCSEFGSGGVISHNEDGRFLAKQAPAPSSCPAICGNGVLDVGEQCDDGNANDQDGCTNLCTGETCSAEVYESTWEAIQDVVFAGYDCNNAICHAAPFSQGGLDLTAANAFANLVNQPATVSVLDRIEPGDEAVSFLYNKIAAKTLAPNAPFIEGSPMPANGLTVTPEHLEALRRFIRAGAPETGVVPGTADLLGTCLPPATPNKIPPLDPPALGEGFQIHAAPWPLPASSENEVCYALYYDLEQIPGAIPPGSDGPCPAYMGGPSHQCIFWNKSVLAQDPQSHHSILKAYVGDYPVTDSGWGAWTCKGGPMEGSACNPTGIGIPAPAGADCGPRAGCTGSIVPAVNCIFYGPPDMTIDATGAGTATAPNVGGTQVPLYTNQLLPGVYSAMRTKGVFIINSHAFNLTQEDSTMEQYFNVYFSPPGDQIYQAQSIFNASQIFVQNVPPFQSREYCWTQTMPDRAQVFEIGSHMHKRGVLFRTWAPPNTPCSSVPTCTVPAIPPIYTSTEYSDPVTLRFDPPVNFAATMTSQRTYKFCAKYDNGEADPSTVKRQSTSPTPPLIFAPGGPCGDSETRCIGGSNHGQLCFGNDASCGGGECDACPLRGGVTTEDEMMIMIGSYYLLP